MHRADHELELESRLHSAIGGHAGERPSAPPPAFLAAVRRRRWSRRAITAVPAVVLVAAVLFVGPRLMNPPTTAPEPAIPQPSARHNTPSVPEAEPTHPPRYATLRVVNRDREPDTLWLGNPSESSTTETYRVLDVRRGVN